MQAITPDLRLSVKNNLSAIIGILYAERRHTDLQDKNVYQSIMQDLINRIQNVRKESGLEVTDRIDVKLFPDSSLERAVTENENYIKNETLTNNIFFDEGVSNDWIEFDGIKTRLDVVKSSN